MRESRVTFGTVFGKGWTCFKARPLFWVGTIVLYAVITIAVNVASALILEGVTRGTGSVEIAYALLLVLGVLSVFVVTRMALGLVWMGLASVDGNRARFADLFAKPHLFWRFLFATLLFNLMVLAGFVLLIVPGIYLAVRYFPVCYVLVERETGVLESFREAARLTKGTRGRVFTVGFLGVMAFGIGLVTGQVLLSVVLGDFAPTVMPFVVPLAWIIIAPILLLSVAALYQALRNAAVTDGVLPA